MRKNYFVKLIKYMKNVYNIEHGINKLTDSRVNPKYKTSQVVFPLLLGFMLRIQSLNELKFMQKENEFKNIFSNRITKPSIDTIRDTIKVIKTDGLKSMLQHTVKRAITNKVFDKGTIDGYTVAAIDGTKVFGSNKKCCEKCLTTFIKGKQHYYHSCAVMSLVGEEPNLVLDFEMYNPKYDSTGKDEGEINAAKRLLSKVISEHRSLVDIVTYDALACNPKFLNSCIEAGIDAVIRVKKNNNNSIRQIKRTVNKKKKSEVWENKTEIIEVYEEVFYMGGVEQPLRYVKFAKKKEQKDRSQILIVTTCLDMPLKTLYRIIKARWHIENRVFNNLKTEAAMGHCFIHGGNAVEAILYLIFIASNLFQLFKQRRIRNTVTIQKELVRLLLKGLYLLKYDKDLIFSSG